MKHECRKCENREAMPDKTLCGYCLQQLNNTSMRDRDE